mgnify:CR=1 FL=1
MKKIMGYPLSPWWGRDGKAYASPYSKKPLSIKEIREFRKQVRSYIKARA